MNDPNPFVANIPRLRRTAVHHGREYTTVELDPATLNALLDIADAAHHGTSNELRQALDVFDWQDT